jgi:uncharacterized protein
MPQTKPVSFALVTGASHGLGRAIAAELAGRQINLLLTALPNDGLENTAAVCRKMGVEVHTFEADLTEKEDLRRLAGWASENFNIHLLVNDAGIGGTRKMTDVQPEYLDKMIQLNVTAVALLTHELLPNLLRQREANILNVSSIAAFSPVGFKTVYPATKKFVQHFSEGLREELRGTGVSVSVVYPGPMITNEDIRQRSERQGWLVKQSILLPEQVAKIAVSGLFQKKRSITPGWPNRLYRLLCVLPSRWTVAWATGTVRREVE